MKLLIAVMSCHNRPDFSNAIRSTWGKEVPIEKADLKFFLGRGPNLPKDDEVLLDCGDDYKSIPEKVRAIIKWALEKGYDYVCKLDDDVVMYPSVFCYSEFFKWDFYGMGKSDNGSLLGLAMPYGFCYILSRKSMEIVTSSPIPQEDQEYDQRAAGIDEYWVSWVLYRKGIYLQVDWRSRLWTGQFDIYPQRPDEFMVCVHTPGSSTDRVQEMFKIWRERSTNELFPRFNLRGTVRNTIPNEVPRNRGVRRFYR